MLKDYAYRPFVSQDPNASQYLKNNADIIDPRTFYWIRDFLYDAQAQA